jgi:phage gp46-like protein
MPEFLIRGNEGCQPDPTLLWDSVHIGIEDGVDFVCDFAISNPSVEPLNVGGLQAVAELATAVYLLLFTDLYIPPDHPLAYLADGDNRGGWGDGVDVRGDLGEVPLGSWLWLLERVPLVAAGMPIEQWAQVFALAALAPLQDQGAVAQIVADAVADVENERIVLTVQLYGGDGTIVFDRRFDLVWRQLRR